jgi:methylase of polypeptide subunit release factors
MTPTEDSAEELVKKHASEVAEQIKNAAQEAWGNEAQFRGNLARGRVFEDFAELLSLHPQPRDERTLIRGRADSVYNRFIIEYKAPGVLSAAKDDQKNIAATKQLRDYIEDLAKLERHKLDRLAGVVTDGCYFIFGSYRGGVWHPDDPLPVTPSSTERFLASLYLLSTEKALTADNLVRDFGENSNVARISVSSLYRALVESQNPKVKVIYDQWHEQFSEVCGYEEGSPRLNIRALAKQYAIQDSRPNAFKLFFSIHSYYAMFIKLLALQVVHYYVAPKLGTALPQVASYGSERLQNYLKGMERGGLFKQLGINNFLEGDFFGWYLEVWDESVDKGIRRIVSELANYSLVTLDADPDQTRDLLKKLYQNVMPKQIRHNLGEYYTPDWLAERLLNQLGYTSERDSKLHEKRLLDPACGSGTFLVLAIKRFKDHCADRPIKESEVLHRILANIVGFDLNPLAVITARTNYLLALGDLLSIPRDFDVNLPVYTCDSILTPSQAEEKVGDQYRMMGAEERLYRFKTVVGDFAVPGSLVKAQYIDQLAGIVEECVDGKYSVEDFRKRLLNTFPLVEGEDDTDIKVLEQLYAKIKMLGEDGINGIWARIIKNAFAPLFCEKFDYIAGNPPWVGWEDLPDKYRQDTKPIWEKYGLFTSKGQLEKMRESRKDISMLMLYASMDEYLRDQGFLGFLITQSVFKMGASGEGFRRLRIGDGAPIRVLHIDDMVDLQPFEGASNRTSVIIAKKGVITQFPVPYQLWRKAAGVGIKQDDSLDHVISVTQRRSWVAEPIVVTKPESTWLTGRPKAVKAIRSVIGESYYQAREGANTGGASGVYWLRKLAERPDGLLVVSNVTELGKRRVEQIQTAIEPDLLFPLLRGGDVSKWQVETELYILIVQDPDRKRYGLEEQKVKDDYPKTYAYLKHFQSVLESRPDRKYYPEDSSFFTMRNVADYTFAVPKVVWKRMGGPIAASVATTFDSKPVVPQDTLSFIPCTSLLEAHYLCALLNSLICDFALESFSMRGGKSFASPETVTLVNISQFSSSNKFHTQLATLSQQAHQAKVAGDQNTIRNIEKRIDELVAKVWGLTKDELKEIQESLAELRS